MKTALIQQHATRNRADNVMRGLKALEEAAAHGARLIVYAELDLNQVKTCTARKYFLLDRRPDIYPYL